METTHKIKDKLKKRKEAKYIQTDEGAVPSGKYDDLMSQYKNLLDLNTELNKQNEELKKWNHKLKRDHEWMELEHKKMKDELDQIKHEVKVMGNTRNYIETSDLVKWLDNNLGEN